MKCWTWCFPSLKLKDKDEVDLDEDIDNYWTVLDEKARNWAIKEDHYSTENLGLQILTKRQKARLLESKMTERRTLQGCHSYDILANPLYFDDF